MAVPSAVRHFYEFGDFRLDADKHRLLCDGEVVPLPPKAIEALIVLVQHPGKLLEREALMQAVWADTHVEDANLTVAISHLRKGLAQNGETTEYIETIPRVGYRFVLDVRTVEERPAPLIVEKYTLTQTVIEEETVADEKGEDRPAIKAVALPRQLAAKSLSAHSPMASSWKIGLVAALAVVVLTASALVLYRYLTTPKVEVGTEPVSSVAVLPLKNLTGDPNDEYLIDGLTEGLISALSRIEGLKVISNRSVFAFKGKEIDPREVGKRLGVMSVLEGSLQKSKDSARVSVRLVSTEDGRVLWAGDSADHSFGDMFAIQDELTRNVTSNMRVKLSGEGARQIAKRYTDNPAAYQLYLKGRYFWNKRTEEGLKKAIEYFQRAIDRDGNYALAYAGLADCYALLTYHSQIPLEESHLRARAAAMKALEIDDTIAEAHASLGFIEATYDWDLSTSEGEYKRAIELNPNYATAHHWYAFCLLIFKRYEEGILEMKRAQEIDPLSVVIQADLGWAFYFAREYDQAIEQHLRAIDMDPSFAPAHQQLGLVYQQKGESAEAIKELQTAIGLCGDGSDASHAMGVLGCVYGLSGKRDEAQRVLALLKRMPKKDYYSIASIYSGLGDRDQAFEWLEREYKERDPLMLDLTVNPCWDGLRSDPRYGDLLRRMRLG